MRIGDLGGSRFTKTDDIDKDVVITITDVGQEVFEEPNGKRKKKAIVHAAELSKPLVVGSVGIEQLNKIFGTTARDDSDGWIGKRAVLYVDRNVVFGGKLTSGLRFKPLPGKRGSIEDMESDVPM